LVKHTRHVALSVQASWYCGHHGYARGVPRRPGSL